MQVQKGTRLPVWLESRFWSPNGPRYNLDQEEADVAMLSQRAWRLVTDLGLASATTRTKRKRAKTRLSRKITCRNLALFKAWCLRKNPQMCPFRASRRTSMRWCSRGAHLQAHRGKDRRCARVAPPGAHFRAHRGAGRRCVRSGREGDLRGDHVECAVLAKEPD